MCHHYRHDHERRARDVQSVQTPAGPTRVSDADRERVAELLRDHAAAGRLDTQELEERLEGAYAARYGSDLQAVLAELPPAPAPRVRARRPHVTAVPLLPLPLAIAALVALAAITSTWWLLWLIWPIVIVLGPRRHYRRARF